MLELTCLFADDINATVDIYGGVENLTVGYPHEIYCEVDTGQVVNSDLVNITWIGPDNNTVVNDSRIIVTTTNSIGNNHTSTLQFLNLIEDDKGLYTCLVAIPGNTISVSEELSVSSKLLFVILVTIAFCDGTYNNSLIEL